ncbi:exopolysaccharide biosynthesis polyprenyl glycosylphosphotransferase [Natrialba chahannaoensis JCM 10990]|uniref:Exopolysaccharide biosynthesis polyprenyl glycosylphosphotransferase n=1 Tax=Natrialba chahannaoensis JCM 10990 TaxID=1227492 RepID=M0AFY6_9EURY|nr:exopolysaccharide biosynthesis polyprenyl glycosylphosphotransferase [Natrialba chahannaoensis JCM 10990]
MSLCGVVLLTVFAVLVANHNLPQSLFTTYVPVFNRLDVTVLSGRSLYWALGLSVVAVAGSLIPLYKPQPRRVLDTVFLTQKRLIVAGLALSTLGYFNWSYRLPRATVTMTIGVLVIVVPSWFVWIRRRPAASEGRTILIGDDADQLQRVTAAVSGPVLGYLCPSVVASRNDTDGVLAVADGGALFAESTDEAIREVERAQYPERLGGLARLEDVLVEYDIDTVVLAFQQADRAEFFGSLDVCHEHGVAAKAHREYADKVLVDEGVVGELVDIEVEPWDPLDHLLKRLFDIVVAGTALLVLSPVIVLIVIALKLEGQGPVFFSQTRTYLYGETFQILKFRTLKPEKGGEVGTVIDEDRRTPLGTFLRTTHLDEIPQLWSILVGDMSVVGPRPAQTELEPGFESEAVQWKQRWFVKPGLTGLAQINNATSQEPDEKIQYDLHYIRTQSLRLDVKILLRQFWKVVEDVVELVARN